MAHTIPAPHTTWESQAEASLPHASLRRVALATAATIILGIGGLTLWAACSTLESAVPASGYFVAAGKRKTVSINDNSILKELEVKEGDHVKAGQVLLKLDDVQARAQYDQAHGQYWAASARLARLRSEAQDWREMEVPEALRAAAEADPSIDESLNAERKQFQARWDALDGQIRVNDQRTAQAVATIASLKATIASTVTKLDLTQKELKDVNYLMGKGLETRPHQLDVMRAVADLQGNLGDMMGKLNEAQKGIDQITQETRGLWEARRADISKDRADTQAMLSDAQQRMVAAQDVLAKQVVVSPQAGVVTDVKYFTPGSSITGGQPIMDIEPLDDRLIVEGMVSPDDIQHVAVGQRVNVKLTAYKVHDVPVIPGKLVYVGADRQMDPNNQPGFLVRAEVDASVLAKHPGVTLYPGMAADVLIINGAHSALDFFTSPIRDSIRHAMLEK